MESGGRRNDRRSGQRGKPTSDHAWRLQDAKARFSEVVRLARTGRSA
jgi:hypothetical protein